MSQDALKVGIIADDKTGKGIASAQKSIKGLEKTVVGLGKSFATVFAGQKLYSYGKTAAKAFADDQKSALLLTKAVDNLGLSFENNRVSDFIANMEKASGIVDGELRPAMQSLLTTTGSVNKSQLLLSQAIDISRGSGVDLNTVVDDLTKAYIGQRRGIEKYKLGLTRAELSTMSFTEVQKALNKQFDGSSAAYLETYSGQLDILTVAVDNAKESIGKGIFDAIANANGGSTPADAVAGIENVTNAINGLVSTTGLAIGALTTLYRGFNSFIDEAGKAFFTVATFGRYYYETYKAPTTTTFQDEDIQSRQHDAYKNAAKRKAAEDAAAKRAREIAAQNAKLLAAQRANTAEMKKQALLKKQSTLFDLEQIQLVAALKGQLSTEDRKRVELQLALLQGNEDVAKRLSTEIANSIDKTGNLAKYLQTLPDANNPFKNWDAYLTAIEERIKKLNINPSGGGGTGGTGGTGGGTGAGTGTGQGGSVIDSYVPNTNYVPMPSVADIGRLAAPMSHGSSTIGDYLNVTLNIDSKEVASAVQTQALNGNISTINRAFGNFS